MPLALPKQIAPSAISVGRSAYVFDMKVVLTDDRGMLSNHHRFRCTRTALFFLSVVVAVVPATADLSASAASPTAGAAHYGTWGVDETLMDKTVAPGDDFFRYALGSWLKTAQIAPDKSRAGYNYDLPDETERDVRAMVEKAEHERAAPPYVRQIVDFYAAWMDDAGIERAGLAPATAYLRKIAAVGNQTALAALMVQPGYAAPLRINTSQDDKDPTRYAVVIGQARLGLPSRDYYLLTAPKYVAIRAAYRDYIVRIVELSGAADPGGTADRIIALETRLATDQWTPERRRDPQATYNPMTLAQLAQLAPQVSWPTIWWRVSPPKSVRVPVVPRATPRR